MLKKTANGGLTLLDRAIKYLGAEQYDPAEVWRATMPDIKTLVLENRCHSPAHLIRLALSASQIRSLRCKVIRLVSLVEMKYKDVSFEVLHSKKEKVRGVVLRMRPKWG